MQQINATTTIAYKKILKKKMNAKKERNAFVLLQHTNTQRALKADDNKATIKRQQQ